jgi:hypothetical protein
VTRLLLRRYRAGTLALIPLPGQMSAHARNSDRFD